MTLWPTLLNPSREGGRSTLTLGNPASGFHTTRVGKLPFNTYRLKLVSHNVTTTHLQRFYTIKHWGSQSISIVIFYLTCPLCHPNQMYQQVVPLPYFVLPSLMVMQHLELQPLHLPNSL